MIVFISNFLNHHQVNICNELAKKDEFYFIASEPVAKEQLNLGYDDMNNQYHFVIRMYESEDNKKLAQNILNEADVAIAGSCAFPFEMLVPRLEKDKLTFWFSERLFKISWLELFYPPKLKRVLSQCTKYRNNKNFYLLCAGGYVAGDYKWYNAFKDMAFTWGYFPKSYIKNELQLFSQKQTSKLKLIWVSRYLKLKRPEWVVYAAEILRDNNFDFEIDMIGSGILYDKISKLIKKKHLEKYVIQKGALPYKQVREEMDKANIFLFTSTRREGWGAVLNESMNSGCAIIADKAIGGAKSMIIDGENGLLFSNKKQFKKLLLVLARDRNIMKYIAENAYKSVIEVWSANVAADRFYSIATTLLTGKTMPIYEDGPMMLIKG